MWSMLLIIAVSIFCFIIFFSSLLIFASSYASYIHDNNLFVSLSTAVSLFSISTKLLLQAFKISAFDISGILSSSCNIFEYVVVISYSPFWKKIGKFSFIFTIPLLFVFKIEIKDALSYVHNFFIIRSNILYIKLYVSVSFKNRSSSLVVIMLVFSNIVV